MAESVRERSESEIEVFASKLADFRATLPASRQGLLDTLVMANSSDAEAPADAASETLPAVSESDGQAFMEQLNAFHDGLPGDEHEILDALVAGACYQHGEVRAHLWHNHWTRSGNIAQSAALWYQCYREGGKPVIVGGSWYNWIVNCGHMHWRF